MSGLSLFNVSYVRVGISIALVCMTTPEPLDKSDSVMIGTGEFQNWSSSTKGYLLSAAFYGFIIGPSVSGFLSFKYGGKIILIIGTVCTGITYLFIPEGTRLSVYLFFTIRVVSGFFISFNFPAFYDIMAHWVVPEERQLLVGGALVGVPLASILNFPLSTLICSRMGWVWVFYLFGFWLMITGLSCFYTIYNYPENCPYISHKEMTYLITRIPNTSSPTIPWRKIVISLPIYAYIVMHFCMNYVFLTLVLSLPLLLQDIQMSLEKNGLLSATPFMGSFVMRVLISFFFEQTRMKLKLSKNMMRKIFLSVGAVLVSLFFLIITFLSRSCPYGILACFILASCSLEFCITGGYLLSLLDLCPSYVNIITGIANSIGNTAGLIGPMVNGYITTSGTKEEWNIVFYVNVAILLLSTMFYLVFGQNHLLYWGLANLRTAIPRASLVT